MNFGQGSFNTKLHIQFLVPDSQLAQYVWATCDSKCGVVQPTRISLMLKFMPETKPLLASRVFTLWRQQVTLRERKHIERTRKYHSSAAHKHFGDDSKELQKLGKKFKSIRQRGLLHVYTSTYPLIKSWKWIQSLFVLWGISAYRSFIIFTACTLRAKAKMKSVFYVRSTTSSTNYTAQYFSTFFKYKHY